MAARPGHEARLPPRYRVLEVLGAGGMGMVVGALDRELDRRVAIKLLHRIEEGDEGQARLRREAQAMAQLSHPHVVQVYDVGAFEGRLYVAMEWVEGRTLAQWQRERQRSVTELVEAYLQAGEGLAAAHAIGIVHRDFKPANVLVGEDGRVRVVDFGLARSGGSTSQAPATAPALGAEPPPEGDPRLLQTLTTAGFVMGTPAYMAPEQAEGREPEPANDQYSFCVALYEALYGRRPAAFGVSLDEIVDRPAPTNAEVPPRLAAALRRGLSTDPLARFSSMDRLLAELRRSVSGRSRGRAWVLAGASVMAVMGLAWVGAGTAVDPCRAGAAEIEAAWGPAQRDALRDRDVGPEAARIEAQLDERARQWARAHQRVCEESLRGDGTAAMLDLRMRCLEEHRRGLAAGVEALLEGSPDLLRRGAIALEALPAPEACVIRTETDVLVPTDPARREPARRLRDELARVDVLRRGGELFGALELAERVHSEAIALDHEPLLAAAKLRLGQALHDLGRYEEAEAPLEAAYFTARSEGPHEVAMEAVLSMVQLVRHLHPSLEDVEHWIDQECALARNRGGAEERAQCEVDRALNDLQRHRSEPALAAAEQVLATGGLPEVSRARTGALQVRAAALQQLDRYDEAVDAWSETIASATALWGPASPGELRGRLRLGRLLLLRAELEPAREQIVAALEGLERQLGPEHADVGKAALQLAIVLEAKGEYTRSLTLYERALRIFEASSGPRSAEALTVLGNMGQQLVTRGELERGRLYLERGMEIVLELYGEDHVMAAQFHDLLGDVEAASPGREAEAISHYERAKQGYEAAMGPGHLRVAAVMTSMAPVYDRAGRAEEAEAMARGALRIREEAGQAEHVNTAQNRVTLGRLLRGWGRVEEAHAELDRARAQLEAQLEPDNPILRSVLYESCRVEHARGNHAEAVRYGERAVPLYEDNGFERTLPSARLALAVALWDAGVDRARARELAQRARAGAAEVGDEPTKGEADAALRRFGSEG